MITIKVDDDNLRKMLAAMPSKVGRAAELAIDRTARSVRDAVRAEIPKVFDRPVPYTRNSLQLTLTHNHNMMAEVWFRDPDRMGDHYLVPQVDGGTRKLKGFERALGGMQYIPGHGAKIDQYGNVSVGQIRQILSVLGRAENTAGYSANMSKRSASRGKQRDYVWLPRGRGALPPGVYQRAAAAGAVSGRYSTIADRKSRRASGAFAWQLGAAGDSAVRARGLRAVLVVGRKGVVRPRLPFYGIAQKVAGDTFAVEFARRLR